MNSEDRKKIQDFKIFMWFSPGDGECLGSSCRSVSNCGSGNGLVVSPYRKIMGHVVYGSVFSFPKENDRFPRPRSHILILFCCVLGWKIVFSPTVPRNLLDSLKFSQQEFSIFS